MNYILTPRRLLFRSYGRSTAEKCYEKLAVMRHPVVGENDSYWQTSARDAHNKLTAGGVDLVFEIVPNGEHVMTNLIGVGFMQKLEKLR